jgi:hypothetical protein
VQVRALVRFACQAAIGLAADMLPVGYPMGNTHPSRIRMSDNGGG